MFQPKNPLPRRMGYRPGWLGLLVLLGGFLLGGFSFPSIGMPVTLTATEGPGESPSDSATWVPGEIIVAWREGLSASALNLPEGARWKPVREEWQRLGVGVVEVPVGQGDVFLEKLRRLPGVRYVERNYEVRAQLIPDDPLWPQQYGPQHVQAPAAWDVTVGTGDVIVAIVDSGIDAAHPEFSGRLLPGYDFVEDDPVPQDLCGHGTQVAGIAAATGNNAEGIAGIAWEVGLLPIRVLDADCVGSTADVAAGIVAAVERGARVINLSLGTLVDVNVLRDATYYAYTRGVALIAAAGNTGGPLAYPARYDWVLAVGATDAGDARASFSAQGPELDLMAPGVDILSTMPLGSNAFGKNPGYDRLSGTSMAAPHVAGAAALLASQPGFESPDALYQALLQTALDLDVPGRDDETGYGLLQIADALAYTPVLSPTPTPTPLPVSYDVLDWRFCPNRVTFQWRDAKAEGSMVPLFSGDDSVTLPLPFPFVFGGRTYTSVRVTPDGYLTFDGEGGIGENFFLPGIAQPNNFLAVYWDDLRVDPTQGRQIYQATLGEAPNREFVIQWDNVAYCIQEWSYGCRLWGGSLTFQVVLFEDSQEILFQYRWLSSSARGGASATIGLEYADGHEAVMWSYNQAGAIENRAALRFVPYSGTPPSRDCAFFVERITGGDVYWQPPFCVILPTTLRYTPAVLRIAAPLTRAPALPENWLDLGRKADIRLQYVPPPPLSPWPEVYVCYQYTAADLLKAGGRPENLFLAVYDASKGRWQALPTSVNRAQRIIFARAPHFSFYAVATRAPQSLPVTGGNPSGTVLRPPGLGLLLGGMSLFGVGGYLLWKRGRS